MITVAVDEITERLRYTFDFIFLSNGVNYQFVVLGAADFDYRTDSVGMEVSKLLYEKGVVDHQIESSAFRGVGCYKIDGKNDPVATVFYLLTRYEEYLASELDHHNRYKHENSLQYQFGLLEKPLADLLSRAILNDLNLELSEEQRKVTVIPTFDIDNVYAYKLKTGFRRWGAIVKDLLRGDKKRLTERKAVDRGAIDPYDTYRLIEHIAAEFPQTLVFWLSGGDSSFDRNVDILLADHAKLIQQIKRTCAVGLHPSYSSYNDSTRISSEKLKLEKVIGDPVIHSRFHFLHFTLPESYRSLIRADISQDYSMGYAGHCGFRAGTARPFLWFDLEKDEITALKVYPFVYMDGTLNEYMGFSADAAKERIRSLYEEIAVCGGNMIGIWHNETIGDYNHWKGWKEVLLYNLTFNE